MITPTGTQSAEAKEPLSDIEHGDKTKENRDMARRKIRMNSASRRRTSAPVAPLQSPSRLSPGSVSASAVSRAAAANASRTAEPKPPRGIIIDNQDVKPDFDGSEGGASSVGRHVITRQPSPLVGLNINPFSGGHASPAPAAPPVPSYSFSGRAVSGVFDTSSTFVAARETEAARRAEDALQVRINAVPSKVTTRDEDMDIVKAAIAGLDTPAGMKDDCASAVLELELEDIELETNGDTGLTAGIKKLLKEGLKASMPKLRDFQEKVTHATRLEKASMANTQALFIVQGAVERKADSSLTSSKFAFPHLVLLGKTADPDHVLAFIIIRNQVSIGIPYNDYLGAGAFAAEETGMVYKLRIKDVFDTELHPNNPIDSKDLPSGVVKKTDIAKEKLVNSDDLKAENTDKFIRVKREGYKRFATVVSTSILTQTHYSIGISVKHPKPVNSDSLTKPVTAYSWDGFVGQTYDWSSASDVRKAQIKGRIAAENACMLVTAAAVTAGLCLTGAAGGLSAAGIDKVDVGHGCGILAKAFMRRAFDAWVEPSARAKANSQSLDPLDLPNVQGGREIPGTNMKLTGSIFLKLQYAHGGTADKVNDVWAEGLTKKIANLAEKILVTRRAIDGMLEVQGREPTQKTGLEAEMKNIEAGMKDLTTEMWARTAVLTEDCKQYDEDGPEFEKLNASVDDALSILEEQKLRFTSGDLTLDAKEYLSQEIKSSEANVNNLREELHEARENLEALEVSIHIQRGQLEFLIGSGESLMNEYEECELDGRVLTRNSTVVKKNKKNLEAEVTRNKNEMKVHENEKKALEYQDEMNKFNASKSTAKIKKDDAAKKVETDRAAHVTSTINEEVDSLITPMMPSLRQRRARGKYEF